jgi:hypothetical protein
MLPELRGRGNIARMEPTGLLGPLVGIVGKILDVIRGRQRLVLRADVHESLMLYIDKETNFTLRRGTIWIYNGGPARVTVNGAGWEAKDGTRVEAFVPTKRTVEPGEPEIEASGDPARLLRANDEHGGLVRMYVELAGDEKPRRRNLPPDWIGKVRELAEHDRRDSRR